MAGIEPATTEIANIVAGHGEVSLDVAIATLGAATTTGIVIACKRIHLWDKLSPVAKQEFELLDEDMPEGWWRRFKETVPAAVFSGAPLRWHWGRKNHPTIHNAGWQIGNPPSPGVLPHELPFWTPMMDEETGTLI